MNRTTWNAVAVTVVILVGATHATRIPWRTLPDRARDATTTFAPIARSSTIATARLATRAQGIARELPLAVRIGAGIAALAGLALTLRPQRRRAAAERLIHRGAPETRVARSARLSQDAVRYLARGARSKH